MSVVRWIALTLALASASVVGAQSQAETADPGTGSENEAETAAAEDEAPEPPEVEVERPLRVGVSGSEPFVIREGGALSGISIALWEAMAQEIEAEFELVEVESPDDAIDQVEAGEIDLAVGPLSISSARARRVAFTQPYYESAISIAAPKVERGFLDRLAPFFSSAFLGGAGALLLVLLIVGGILWAVERKKNETMPQSPVAGIGTGIWLAVVTMTTVGYGDRVPETPVGRVVCGVWMLVSLVVVSSLTAFLATALTVGALDSGTIARAEDLEGREIAVVEGTTSVPFARRFGGELVREPDLASAVGAVLDGRAEAVVYDRPILQWHLHELEAHPLTVSEGRYEPLGYGFAFSQANDGLGHRLDAVLLALEEADALDDILDTWL